MIHVTNDRISDFIKLIIIDVSPHIRLYVINNNINGIRQYRYLLNILFIVLFDLINT